MRHGLCPRYIRNIHNRERSIIFDLGREEVPNVPGESPLKYIMDPGKAVPVTAAARIQHWCLFLGEEHFHTASSILGAFSYSIEFRGTKQHANCDLLSPLPQSSAPANKPDEVEIFHTFVVEALPVTEQELRMQTRRDPVLSHFLELVQSGWQGTELHPELIPYAHLGNEITIHHGVLMWGSRVVVPAKLRERFGNASRGSNWYCQDKGFVTGVCLVVKYRERHRRGSPKL